MCRQLHSEYLALPRSLSAAEVLDTIPIEFVRQDFFLTQGHSFLPLPKFIRLFPAKKTKENKNFIHLLEKIQFKTHFIKQKEAFLFFFLYHVLFLKHENHERNLNIFCETKDFYNGIVCFYCDICDEPNALIDLKPM